jgi:putative PEP-CTERM system histidine kinase
MGAAPIAAICCAAAYAALFLFTLARGSLTREGRFVLAASAMTVVWAALIAIGGDGLTRFAPLLEGAQGLIWLALLAMLLRPQEIGWRRQARVAAVAIGALAGISVIANDLIHLVHGASLGSSQIVAREGLAVAGLLMVENLYRNIEQKRMWNVVPLCIAIGGFFAYQLFLYSNALLTGAVNPLFAEARPAATLLSAPFLALTLVRNRDWRIDIHISRKVVFHTFTLVVSGVFLLAVATLGALLHEMGGGWGAGAQAITLFGTLLVLAMVLSSGGIKARLQYLVSRNFFSLRYDYRVEWMNFIDILSSREDEDLKRRVIHAVANIVDSPRGALWLSDGEAGFRPAAFLDMRLNADAIEPLGSDFIAGFRGGAWIQLLDRAIQGDGWQKRGDFWIAVPLVHQDRLIGFIALTNPRAPLDLNWESYELLRAVARQAASYICEERATRDLADARSLEEYAKRFAFVGHDIKNLASQLRLLSVNAQRHGDNPEFRADAFRTIESAVLRMNKLLLQLNANGRTGVKGPALLDPAAILAEIADSLANVGARIETELAPGFHIRIDAEHLRSVLTHLISNAIEASPPDAAVTVRGECRDGKLILDIADRGPGMNAEFIEGELFRPFRTTKSGGYGIGAYQTRELIRAFGGELDVMSSPGAGTTMRIILPLASEGAAASAA